MCVCVCVCVHRMGVDCEQLKQEALKRLKGDLEAEQPKKKKSVRVQHTYSTYYQLTAASYWGLRVRAPSLSAKVA